MIRRFDALSLLMLAAAAGGRGTGDKMSPEQLKAERERWDREHGRRLADERPNSGRPYRRDPATGLKVRA